MHQNIKAVSLLSTGIDSPVASWLMKEQGVDIVFLHLQTGKNNTDIVKRLKNRIDKGAKLVIKDFIPTLESITKNTERRLTCVLCKRAMYRDAKKLAKKEKAQYIITGESLGQVASQTLENLYVLDRAVSMPVLRPLLCYDKNKTIKIARKIGTYDISCENKTGCAFVPKRPLTKARLDIVEREEARV